VDEETSAAGLAPEDEDEAGTGAEAGDRAPLEDASTSSSAGDSDSPDDIPLGTRGGDDNPTVDPADADDDTSPDEDESPEERS